MLNMLILQVMYEVQQCKAELDERLQEVSERMEDETGTELHAYLMRQQAVLYEPMLRLKLKELQLQELQGNCSEDYFRKIIKGEPFYTMPHPVKSAAQ